jgi:acetyl/propionyl-CoA carboxylase alpha subunit
MDKLSVTVDGYTYEIELDQPPNGELQMTVWVDGQAYRVIAPDLSAPWSEMEWFIIGNRPYEVMIDPNLAWIRSSWGIHSLEIQDQDANLLRPTTGDGRIKAPIPGQITQVNVAAGDEVEQGQPLLVLEAMKMENEIRAPRSGLIKELKVTPGQRVTLDEVLVEIE